MELDILIELRVTETSFSFSISPIRSDILYKLQQNRYINFLLLLCGQCFGKIYDELMKMVEVIKNLGDGTFRRDCVTEDLSKSKSNVVLYFLLPLFIEYLISNLK